jgi:hypothetical protein
MMDMDGGHQPDEKGGRGGGRRVRVELTGKGMEGRVE